MKKRLLNWFFGWMVLTWSLPVDGHSHTQEFLDEADELVNQISDRIREGALVQASLEIEQFKAGGGPEPKVQLLRMQFLTSLRKDLPDGIDLETEISRYLTEVKSSIEHDPKKIGGMLSAIVYVSPLLSKHKGDEASLALFDDLFRFVDTPERKGIGAGYLAVMYSAHRSRLEVMKRLGREAEGLQDMREMLMKIEDFVRAHPNDDKARLTYLSSLDSFATYVSESEAELLLQNANQLTGNWIGDGKQVSELVESLVSVRGQLINLLTRTKTDTAQEILNDTNELLDKCVAGDSSMEKIVPRLRKSLDQYQAKIRIEKSLQAMIGVPAHEFDVIDWVNEKPKTMSQYRGKVVLLDFWAVWCGPCLQTLPELKRWDETYRKDGLRVLGVTNKYNYRWDENGNKPIKVNDGTIVSTEDEIGMLKRFLMQRSIDYPILLTPKGGNMQTDYNVGSIPHMVLIDRLGIIRLVNVGVSKQGLEAIETRIQELLEEPNRPN